MSSRSMGVMKSVATVEDLVVDRVALVLDLMRLLRVLFERGCFRELLDGFNQQRRLGDGKL